LDVAIVNLDAPVDQAGLLSAKENICSLCRKAAVTA
jgi:hypothetical protein